MNEHLQILAWGVAVCAPFALNLSLRRQVDAIGLSGMMVLIWTLGRILWTFFGPPDCLALNPLIDALACATCFIAWATQRAAWKLMLCLFYLGQVALAYDFALVWGDRDILISYLEINNALFVGQLLCVSYPGIADVARILGRRMSHRARAVHSVGPGA